MVFCSSPDYDIYKLTRPAERNFGPLCFRLLGRALASRCLKTLKRNDGC